MLNMIPVSSSNLSSVGYENGTLYVSFIKSGLYSYSNVPEYVFQQLLNAPSKGRYFAEFIKNTYAYRKIG